MRLTVPVYAGVVLPNASFAVTLTLMPVPAVAEPGALTTKFVVGPGAKVTPADAASAAAFSVPVIEAVDAVVEEVSVAV